jgi:hypothetical protein
MLPLMCKWAGPLRRKLSPTRACCDVSGALQALTESDVIAEMTTADRKAAIIAEMYSRFVTRKRE